MTTRSSSWALSLRLFRACRLVIDTGLHWKGWTRARAIDYFVDECGQSRGGATVEVLRYMVWPGQALSYKIGELTIRDIRSRAEQRLGSRFDIRAFHDAVLAEGHMPMRCCVRGCMHGSTSRRGTDSFVSTVARRRTRQSPSRKRVFRPDQPVITHVFVDGDPHLDGDAPYSR